MKYLRNFLPLIGVNVLLAGSAYFGVFEGKDLLPILLGGLFVLSGTLFLLVKRKTLKRPQVIGFLGLVLSAAAVSHVHFNVYGKQKTNTSRAHSMQTLEGNSAPNLSYVHTFNHSDQPIPAYLSEHKYTILNFWATWCTPCLKEMPLLDEFYQAHQSQSIGLIGFTDYRAKGGADTELQKIKHTLDKLEVSYPILVDSSTTVRTAYRADVLPATVLIDQKGKVLDYQIGIDGAKKIMDFVVEALKD